MATASPYLTPRYGWRTPEEYDTNYYTEFCSMLSTMEMDVYANACCAWSGANVYTHVEANSSSWAGAGGANNYTPEYAGAVLRADGGANTGTLTTGFDSTNWQTYYHWAGGAAAIQDYDIVIRLQYSNTWDATNALTLAYRTSHGTNTNCKVDVYIYDTADTVWVNGGQGWANTSWTTGTQTSPGGGTWTADAWFTVIIKLSAIAGHWAEVGELAFQWA
jgi:hypothetical protein